MTQTLQEALLNAGLISKEKLDSSNKKGGHKKMTRAQSGVPAPKPKEESTSVLHEGKHEHHMRTECEACKKTSPDVEFYNHSNRRLSVKWLCIKCADSYKIADNFRLTEQSQFAQSGRFIREHGATKVFR